MFSDIGIGVLDPGDAADHISSEFHGFAHQFFSTWFTDKAVLGKCHHLDVDDSFELLAGFDESLESFKFAF